MFVEFGGEGREGTLFGCGTRMNDEHGCCRQSLVDSAHYRLGASLTRRHTFEHVGVALHNLLTISHRVHDKEVGIASQLSHLVERLASEKGDEEVGLSHIVGGKSTLDIGIGGTFNIHHIKGDVDAHFLQLFQTEEQTFVELNELKALIGDLASLFHIELGGGDFVHLTEVEGHHQRHDDALLWGARPIISKHPQARIVIGKGVRIVSRSEDNYAGINHPTILAAENPNSQIIIHDGVGMSGSSIVAQDYIEIGENTLLGANTNVYDNDFHASTLEGRRNNAPAAHAPIHIGAECWLASNVTVLKGVTIGDRSTIGAMSLVNKDIPSDVLAGGVPAKVIKKN